MFIRNGLVLAFALAWTSVALGFGPQEGSQDAATIRRVQEAMQANRDAFTEFRVEFEVTSGFVASEEDALAGKFVRPERANAIWARLGEDETFRIGFAAREPVVAPVDATQVKANGKPMREIVVREASLIWNKYFVSRGDYFAIHTPMSKVCAIK